MVIICLITASILPISDSIDVNVAEIISRLELSRINIDIDNLMYSIIMNNTLFGKRLVKLSTEENGDVDLNSITKSLNFLMYAIALLKSVGRL